MTLWHTWKFYQHNSPSHSGGELPVPFTLHAAGCLVVIVPGLLAAGWERSNFFKDFLVGIVTISICVVAFPLAQFVCLGKVDDGCAADAVVVFAEGSEGDKNQSALADQIRAACDLYRDGKVHKVILAGRGESPETTLNALRQLATTERIPDKDVVLSTAAKEMDGSVAATAKLVEEQKLAKVLVTGPYYQLPRIKLCCQRAGFDVHTVPIRDKARLQELRPAFLREASALWLAYVQPLLM
jgi:vancomycin permeability regulator SanA